MQDGYFVAGGPDGLGVLAHEDAVVRVVVARIPARKEEDFHARRVCTGLEMPVKPASMPA